ncbi:MAG: glycosyltransferase family 2 protein [Thermodesulfobacteriota bacterium]|nr:glycosyltransferase family 2 protein [Thermodesulfobacteriota bacterium]
MNHTGLEIVLASYNGQTFIAEQLISLQSCVGYSDCVERVLVVDDASVDNTAAIVASFAKHDPRIVWIPAVDGRRGVVANFARGLSLTCSPYVMLCDQDDVWAPDKISLQLELCREYEKSHGREQPLLVFSDLQVVGAKLQQLSPSFFSYQKLEPEWSERLSQLLIQNVAPGCTLLLNRALIDKALPVPPQAVMHDWWLMLVARGFGQILWLDQPLVQYRQHGGNQIGAKQLDWRWLFALKKHCQVAAENLKRQGRQAQILWQRYGHDSDLQLEESDRLALAEIGQLAGSSVRQRLCSFMRGNLRKNNILRNLGLLLVLVVWSVERDAP